MKNIKKHLVKFMTWMALISMISFGTLFSVNAESKPKIKVYLLAGQSNMCGVGKTSDLPDNIRYPQTNVLAYSAGQVSYPQYTDRMAKLNGYLGADFGPELMFGLDMEKAYKDDNIALIKVAYGATSLAVDWNPTTPGFAYKKFRTVVKEQMESLKVDYEPVIDGMLWMQGEADAGSIEQANAYEQNLRNFIKNVKTDFNCPNLKLVIGRISNSSAWVYRATVRPAQEKVANELKNTSWINTDDLPMVDMYHYNSDGQLTLGSRFATAMQKLIASEPSSTTASVKTGVSSTTSKKPFTTSKKPSTTSAGSVQTSVPSSTTATLVNPSSSVAASEITSAYSSVQTDSTEVVNATGNGPGKGSRGNLALIIGIASSLIAAITAVIIVYRKKIRLLFSNSNLKNK